MWLFLSNCSCKILLFITNFIYAVAQDPKQMWKNDNGFFFLKTSAHAMKYDTLHVNK